ncbi:penicillin acylase family protein [Isoalcanivorax indicus]|uniref:penicillin acylase family protein n=1 Tax=Isoalcanivorax indicus TaxID=2202653 RepID=UPI0013C4D5D4|nr:penicillin acylase family protein [Isoalcanivorax indicus]
MRRGMLFGLPVLVLLLAGITACSGNLLDRWLAGSMDPVEGELVVPGLAQSVQIRRDELGIPHISAESREDLAFAIGWVMANDRLSQMVGFTLAAQGRLAEMAGEVALPMDLYARSLDLRAISVRQLEASSDELRALLEHFSNGVNAWMAAYAEDMPLDFRLGDFSPEPWTPLNSADVFTMVNLGLGMNLHEEIMALNLAERVGTERLPWLMPIYPDQALPFDEAAKLADLDMAALRGEVAAVDAARAGFERLLMPQGLAASNNWAVAPSHTRDGRSLLANDTHLLISQPPMWMLMHVRTPDMEAAGVALAGIPVPVLGFNGDFAWGATMVMADAQDLFIEQLREIDGVLHYRVQDDWQPAEAREETFHVLGGESVTHTLHRTRNGPLIGAALDAPPVSPVVPPRLALAAEQDERPTYGLAFAWTAYEADDTMDAMFRLGQSRSLEEARTHVRDVRFIHLNMVMADADNIGWQVTGRYPLRGAGTGQLPSPGWVDTWRWQGFADVDAHPSDYSPSAGHVGTANHRTVAPDYPLHMSHSWFAPQRGERVDALLAARDDHDAASMVAMQADRHDALVPAMQSMLRRHAGVIDEAMATLPSRRAAQARDALDLLMNFDGDMAPESAAAAVYGVFFHTLARNTFLDELGPEDSPAWDAFTRMTLLSYSAIQDHLLQREDSPFWNNVNTDRSESKWDIVALSLADAWQYCRERMGRDPANWAWGDLHTYTWQTAATQMKPWLSRTQRWGLSWLDGYLNRGPYPAGGNHNTLNVAGYPLGRDFAVHSIPAMRMVVDFAAEEPLQLVNSGGQSGNPASPHYDDGIEVWLGWQNRTLPFGRDAVQAHYNRLLVLRPAD